MVFAVFNGNWKNAIGHSYFLNLIDTEQDKYSADRDLKKSFEDLKAKSEPKSHGLTSQFEHPLKH